MNKILVVSKTIYTKDEINKTKPNNVFNMKDSSLVKDTKQQYVSSSVRRQKNGSKIRQSGQEIGTMRQWELLKTKDYIHMSKALKSEIFVNDNKTELGIH